MNRIAALELIAVLGVSVAVALVISAVNDGDEPVADQGIILDVEYPTRNPLNECMELLETCVLSAQVLVGEQIGMTVEERQASWRKLQVISVDTGIYNDGDGPACAIDGYEVPCFVYEVPCFVYDRLDRLQLAPGIGTKVVETTDD